MSQPGSTPNRRQPAVVRRTKPAASSGRGSDSSARTPSARRSTNQTDQSAPQAASRAGTPRTEVPQLGIAMYLTKTVSGSTGALLLRLAGVAAIVGTVLIVVADLLPYLMLGGEEVRAEQNIFSILAHLVLLVLGLGAGALMLTGRGGRVGPVLIGAPAALAPGILLQHVFAGSDPVRHRGSEYHFGELYTTANMQGLSGRTLVIVGWVLLLVAGLLALWAFFDIAERDLLTVGAARPVAGGAAGFAALLAVTGFLVQSAATAISKYTDPSGLVLTREIQQPPSVISYGGLGFIAGILLLAGWVVAAAIVGAMSSRVTIVAALVSFGMMALYSMLLNARDVLAGPDLILGPRFYLLLGAAIIALGAAAYTARVRTGPNQQIVSA